MAVRQTSRSLALFALFGLLTLLLPAVPAGAAGPLTFVVTSTGESAANDANCAVGSCTLRQAVNASNANDPGAGNHNTITFASGVTGTITQMTATFDLKHDVAIVGPGARALTLSHIDVEAGVTASVSGLTFSGSTGIYNDSGTVTVAESVFTSGTFGIFVLSGTATVARSTFTNNSTGINMDGGALILTNSTFRGDGQGIFFEVPGTLTATNSTITGGTYGIEAEDMTFALEESIVTGSAQADIIGTPTGSGHNLIGGDPKLGPLADNGGPTDTLLPLPGSPAIDAGGATCPATDQRGIKRPQGPACDIGAVEVVPTDTTPPTITPTITGMLGSNGWYTGDVTVTWAVTDPQSAIISKTGCDPVALKADTAAAGATFTCAATSAGGTATQSVTIKRDATKPTVTYGAHPASYTLDQTVAITCTTADPTPGSGIAATTCTDINSPASSFAIGANTLSATATDAAGNVGTGQTSFTVRVTPSSLVAVTLADIEGSAKFKALPAKEQARVRALGAAVVQRLKTMPPNLPPAEQAKIVKEYTVGVKALVAQGWLTATQGQTLTAAAGAL